MLLVHVSGRVWLIVRQARHVSRHRHEVPAICADHISLSAHQRAASYTLARCQGALLEVTASAAMFIGLTLLGGIEALARYLRMAMATTPYWQPAALVGVVGMIAGLTEAVLAYYTHFGIEAKFGFNRMTRRLFLTDTLKSTGVGLLLGAPLIIGLLTILTHHGPSAWGWAWLVWALFSLSTMLIYPSLIAPLFNRFSPLAPGPLRTRIEALLARCGYRANGVFVMDNSRRSAHGNAYFSGLGPAKRIVLYDTLLEQLDDTQIEAVLAHELGHFKHRHLLKRLFTHLGLSLVLFGACATLTPYTWFYSGLGVTPETGENLAGYALVLCLLTLPWAGLFVQPLLSTLSRHHEFQADAYAARHTSAAALTQALLRLYRDNAATLTPDPWYSAVFDSHPPALTRIARLQTPCAPT